MGPSYHTLYPRVREHHGRRALEDCKGKRSGRITAKHILNRRAQDRRMHELQQICLPAKDLYKVKLVRTLTRSKAPMPPPLAEQLLTTGGQEMENQFPLEE